MLSVGEEAWPAVAGFSAGGLEFDEAGGRPAQCADPKQARNVPWREHDRSILRPGAPPRVTWCVGHDLRGAARCVYPSQLSEREEAKLSRIRRPEREGCSFRPRNRYEHRVVE